MWCKVWRESGPCTICIYLVLTTNGCDLCVCAYGGPECGCLLPSHRCPLDILVSRASLTLSIAPYLCAMEAPLSTQPAYMLAPVTAVHPPDLETDDPSLATEVLPAPPPLASIIGQRRDSHLRRPTQVFSYLPASDPGTTYSGLMGGLGLVLVPEEESRLRKRARTEKTYVLLFFLFVLYGC
jgi:hypothetical protein